MGASGQWLKSLMGSRNTDKSDPVKEKASSSSRGKRWKLWRSFSGELRSGGKGSKSEQMDSSNASEDCLSVDDHFSAAVAAVVRAPLKDFRVVRQEWAAVRIQTAFRGFLARRALRALKGIVRIQAIFRGRQVRKQAAITLRCMQALVRAQARVRASQVWSSTDGKSSQKVAHSQFNMMAIKPWETRLMTKLQSEPNKIPSAKTSEDYNRTRNRSPNPSSVRVRKNNITTRISAGLPSNQSSNGSAPSSECYYAESSPSSSACTFTSVSGPTPESSEKLGIRYIGSPSYMNLTESVKARRRSRCYNRFQRQSMDDFEFHKKSALGFGESRSSVGSDHAFNCSRGTYQR